MAYRSLRNDGGGARGKREALGVNDSLMERHRLATFRLPLRFHTHLLAVLRWSSPHFPLRPLGLWYAMRLLPFSLILALLAFEPALGVRPAKRHYTTHDYYVLEHNPNAGASLAETARSLGVEVVERAGELHNHWLVRTAKPPSQGLVGRDSEDRVYRALDEHRRRAASSLESRSEDASLSKRVSSSVKYLSRQELRQRVKRAPPPIPASRPQDSETALAVAQRMNIVDPEFPQQWHLVNDDFPQHMMNVTAVWDMGITGKGVISALVDDGLDYNSDDLAANFVRIFHAA